MHFERNKLLLVYIKQLSYLLDELFDGLNFDSSIESGQKFEKMLTSLVRNEEYYGVYQMVKFCFSLDLKVNFRHSSLSLVKRQPSEHLKTKKLSQIGIFNFSEKSRVAPYLSSNSLDSKKG